MQANFYASWIVLALAIIATVLSFRISDAAINGQLQQIDRYYHERDERSLVKSKLAHSVDWFNNTSGALFVLGVILTVVFVIFNFSEAKSMSKTLINEGQTIPTMQKLSDNLVKKGQSIPQVQKVPQPQSPPAAPAQPATSAGQTAATTQKKVATGTRDFQILGDFSMTNKSGRGPTHANDGQTIPHLQKMPQSQQPIAKPTVAPASKSSGAGQSNPRPTTRK